MATVAIVLLSLVSSNAFAQYSDLKAFNLKGSVQSVISEDMANISDGPVLYGTIEFNSEGQVELINDEPLSLSEGTTRYAKRNDKGEITEYYETEAPEGVIGFKYTYDEQGRIKSNAETVNGKFKRNNAYTYDSNNNLTKCGFITYTIDKVDDKGNWLQRTYKLGRGIMVEKREILYY